MGLETGTYIQDLNENNPISGDPVAEGDNHLRLIKAVLKNTFPSATRSMPTPTGIYRPVGSYGVTAAQENALFLMDTTSGQVDLFMPTLAGSAAGWECTVMKVSWNLTAGYIRPPSGTIQSGERTGLPYTRRCIPGMPTRVLWTGSNWHCSRVPSVPVGTVLPYQGGDLPVGYEWPNSQALNTSLYPEFAQVRGGGVTLDHRGRVPMMADQGAGRVGTGYVGGMNSPAYGGEGGLWVHQLTVAELASHNHIAYINDPTHGHNFYNDQVGEVGSFSLPVKSNQTDPGGNNMQVSINPNPNISIVARGTGVRVWDGGTLDYVVSSGSSAYHNNMQPSIVEHFILVVE